MTRVYQSKRIVTDLNNGWKIAVSFRRGFTALCPNSEASESVQHYRIAVSFFQSPVFSEAKPKCIGFSNGKYRREFRLKSLSVCFPKFTVFVKPEYLDCPGLPEPPNNHHGIFTCLPTLYWEKYERKRDISCYQWTPTAHQRRAAIALGLRKGIVTAVLELFLNDQFGVSHLLRPPDPGEFSVDYTEAKDYYFNDTVQADQSAEQNLENFVATAKERNTLQGHGSSLELQIKGLPYKSPLY